MTIPPPSIADRTFRTVLRGWDPKEVREYLLDLEVRFSSASGADVDARRRADAIIAAARVEADTIVGAARREADDLGRHHDAMDAWFGPDQRPSPDRWGELGDHIARIVAQAEAEARAIVADAHAEAAAARTEADALLEQALPRARAHVQDVLGVAQAELDAKRVQLADVQARLAEVHEQLARSIADPVVAPELTSAQRFVDLVGSDLPAPAVPAAAFSEAAGLPPVGAPTTGS